MFNRLLSLSLMATSALALEAFSPVLHLGAMHPRDTLAKRQGYYPPPGTPCRSGDTCQEACGANTELCPSQDDTMHCFDPTVGLHCCNDLTGNSCQEGYFCTNDPAGATFCCPDGMDLTSCAAAYSLTVSLIRATATLAPSVPSSVVEAETTSTLIHVSSIPAEESSTTSSIPAEESSTASSPPPVSFPTPVIPVLPTGNATYTGPGLPEFTGAAVAGKVVGAGVAVLAGAAGVVGLL